VLGAFALPENRPTGLPSWTEHSLKDVGTGFAFGHRLDKICGELRREKCLEFHFLHFALQLLRTLFGFLFENFDLSPQAGDGFVAFGDFQNKFFFGLVLGFQANVAERLLDALLNSELKRALLVVKLPLLADQFGLCVLSHEKFLVFGFHDGLKLCEFTHLSLEFIRDKSAGFARFLLGDRLSFASNARLDLRVDLLPGRG